MTNLICNELDDSKAKTMGDFPIAVQLLRM